MGAMFRAQVTGVVVVVPSPAVAVAMNIATAGSENLSDGSIGIRQQDSERRSVAQCGTASGACRLCYCHETKLEPVALVGLRGRAGRRRQLRFPSGISSHARFSMGQPAAVRY